MRSQNISEVQRLGARKVKRVFRSADEVSHSPRKLAPQDVEVWQSDVLFLGTWMPERGSFLLDLVRKGVPLTIRGARWEKSDEWPELKRYWKGGHITGDDYAKAIQCAKVNLGLLSKGNRDLHTTRSLEIPALGGLLCAERTSEHCQLYEEDKEALFWSDADECAAKCFSALQDVERSRAIASNGHARYMKNGLSNERICQDILAMIRED